MSSSGTRIARRVALALVLASAGIVSAHAQDDSQDAKDITITADRRWRSAAEGSWTSYAVTIRNNGPDDADGEVVLVPGRDPPPVTLAGQREPEPPDTTDVTALAARVMFDNPPSGTEPALGDFPLYRSAVVVAAGTTKTLSFLVVEPPGGYRAEFRDRKGRTLTTEVVVPPAQTGAQAIRQTLADPPFAVLSRVAANADALSRLPSTVGIKWSLMAVDGRDFPENPIALNGLKTVVLIDFDSSVLNPAQLRALQAFVALGGNLVVIGGPTGGRTLAALPPELVPLRPTGTAEVSMSPLAELAGTTTDVTATVVTGELAGGLAVVQAVGGPPLVVQADYGAGRIVQLAYDPLTLPPDGTLNAVAWDQGPGRALSQGAAVPSPPPQLWAPVLERPAWPPIAGWAVWVLAGYVVAASAAFIMLGARRTPTPWGWVALPAMAVVAGAALVPTNRPTARTRTSSVEVTTFVAGAGMAITNSFNTRWAPGRENSLTVIRSGDSAAATPIFAGATRLPEPMRARGGSVIVAGGATTLSLPVPPFDARPFQIVKTSVGQGLEAHLRMVSKAPADRISGTVTNHSGRALHDLRAQLPDGGQARLADLVRPGETVHPDAAVLRPTAVNPGSLPLAGAEEMAMFAAAKASFNHSADVALTGVERSTGKRPRRSPAPDNTTKVVVQPARLEGSDSLGTTLPPSHFVAIWPCGGANPRCGHVLEVGAPPAVQGLQLEYPRSARVPTEVYDWTTGRWRALPRPQDGGGLVLPTVQAPLSPGEVNHGIVRVRNVATGTPPGNAWVYIRVVKDCPALPAAFFANRCL